jgi:hypothetical protein
MKRDRYTDEQIAHALRQGVDEIAAISICLEGRIALDPNWGQDLA